ncbi:MAG: hypoxanthine phosphoribosyltransferase [Gemmatimonadota bacterium]
MPDARLEVVLSREALQARVSELGAEIAADYRGRELVLVCLLKGAAFFLADLARAVDLPLTIEFLRAASYGVGTASSGSVRIEEVDGVELAGRDVILVEDIVDSGHTLAKILEFLRERGARTLEVCTLLYKERGVEHPFRVRYIGFRIEDRFVVGYGLDHAETYRNLPYLAALRV